MPPCDLLSNMAQQLPLILPVNGNRLWRQNIRPIPHAIELPQAAAQFLPYFDSLPVRRPPPPSRRKLVKIMAIGSIATNRQPLALRQSGQQAQVRRAQRQPQFT